MCYEVLKTYVNIYERACLEAIQNARLHLMQDSKGQNTKTANVSDVKSLMVGNFYTRLSNIHQCILAIEPFMEEMPLLWCSSKAEFDETLKRQASSEYGIDDDQVILFEDDEVHVFDEKRMLDTDFFANRIVQKLRTVRANVIASLTELIEERIAPFIRVAILDKEEKTRSAAVRIVFMMIDSELKLMNERLAPGAFRLALSSMHKGVCDAIEQLILHRPIEEGALEASERWRGLPTLTEMQHSLVVELMADVREFFHCDGAGEPESILKDGEGRLRRLLNLWFTPTIEIMREFWQLKEVLSRSIVSAHGKQIRLRSIGGVAVQDILLFAFASAFKRRNSNGSLQRTEHADYENESKSTLWLTVNEYRLFTRCLGLPRWFWLNRTILHHGYAIGVFDIWNEHRSPARQPDSGRPRDSQNREHLAYRCC